MVIAAISTPQGIGGIGVIRISGKGSVEVAQKCFRSRSGKMLTELKGYTALYGDVIENNMPVDSCVALVFRSPNSYTGEDVVELSVHGGIYVVNKVLRIVLDNGARLADPGEFTKRAFLNGKIDLAEAESVMNIISASGDTALAASKSTLDGRLSKEIRSINDNLINISASMAIWTDSPDDENFALDIEKIRSRLSEENERIKKLIKDFDNGRAYTEGISAVICGKPNVGKSTLMNYLSQAEKSIVTDIAGTTRDIVEETVKIGDIVLRLSDTAGIRETEDVVERIGVERAKQRIDTSVLVIPVFDVSEEPSEDDVKLIEYCKNHRNLAVFNKNDIKKSGSFKNFERSFEHFIYISAKEGTGMEGFEEKLKEVLNIGEIDISLPMLMNERQRICAVNAQSYLETAIRDLIIGITPDAVNIMIDSAINSLGVLSGEKATNTVTDEVFAKFCVGK